MRRLLSAIRCRRESWRRTAMRAAAAAFSCAVSLTAATGTAEAVVVNDAGTQAGVALVPSARNNPLSLPSGVSAVTSTQPCTDHWLSADLGGPTMPIDGGLCYRGGAVMHRNDKNKTFALTWDAPLSDGSQQRQYWSETRGYMEQYLRDVADASGSLSSPYAVTTQYNDNGGHAQSASIFGGGCIDYGRRAAPTCEFGNPTGAGHDFLPNDPANGCAAEGDSFIDMDTIDANTVCLTGQRLESEVSSMAVQTGIVDLTHAGYTPLVTLLLPPGVETCLDRDRKLCSANAYLTPPPPKVTTDPTGGHISAGTYRVALTYVTAYGELAPSASQTVTTTGSTSSITITSPPAAPAASGVVGWYAYVTTSNGLTFRRQSGRTDIGTDVTLTNLAAGGAPPSQPAFCSYHSHVRVGTTDVAYVVQPWTAGTSCDEPGAPTIPDSPTPHQLSVAIGQRLVSPLSQSNIAAIVNTELDGWAALEGWEIDDNDACIPLANDLDKVTVGSSSQNPYYLQREWNNAAALEFEPYTYFGCAPGVTLSPTFVVPSAVDHGDVVQFDGSATSSTLIVPNDGYTWNFGDGTSTTMGPSVVHSYAQGGVYTVTLKVRDRGGNEDSISQSITVLGPAGQIPSPPTTQPSPPTTQSAPPATQSAPHGASTAPALQVRIRLTPRSLTWVLHHGIALQVRSNKVANGILTVSISRAVAKRAHIKLGRASTVVIGRGTTAGIRNGVSLLSLHLPTAVAAKLSKLRHLTLSVRLTLVAAGGGRLAIDAAARY